MNGHTGGASESSPWEIKVGLKMRHRLGPLAKTKREFPFVSPEDRCSDWISLGHWGRGRSLPQGTPQNSSTSVKNRQKNAFAALPSLPGGFCEIRKDCSEIENGAHACSQVLLEVCRDRRARGSMGREGRKG